MSLLNRLHQALEPHLGERTDAALREGMARLNLQPNALDPDSAATLLKRFVYRELQRSMDAARARRVVEELLEQLGGDEAAAPTRAQTAPEPSKEALMRALSRFKLYFEWPEVQRLRSIVALIEASESEGEPTTDLLKEGMAQVDLLEEKLQNALLRQARDITDLEDALERVKNIGGPKLRRLQSLLKQIKEAQQQETLATAEVERARKLAADLRKLVESSVVQNPTLVPETPRRASDEQQGVIPLEDEEEPELATEEFDLVIDFENLEPEVVDRIREIDLAEEQRRLERLREQHAAVLEAKAVRPLLEAVEAKLAAGEPAGTLLDELQSALEEAAKDALAEARARYEWLSERLRGLEMEDPELPSARARSQLELIRESLEMGVLPTDLDQAERQIKALEEGLEAKRREQVRRERLLEEARSLVAHAHEALPEDDVPEAVGFRERLALLEAGLNAGDVDEALLARLKAELPELLSQLAQAGEAVRAARARLLAELEALPNLEPIVRTRDALKLRLEESDPEALAEEVTALQLQARALVGETLERLAERARRFGVEVPALTSATAELAQGRFPDLAAVEREVEAHVAEAQAERKRKIKRLRTAAERLRGLGGEALLLRLDEAEAGLAEGLPDLEPLERRLQELLAHRDALRRELGERYHSLRERFETARAVGGETAYRAHTLLSFLEKGAARLERLGSGGLTEMARALDEAEHVVAQLEQEYAAAKEVAQQLSATDLEDLLGVFADGPAAQTDKAPAEEPAPAEPADDALTPFRIRGVLWAHQVGPGESVADLDGELLAAFASDLEQLREEVGAEHTRMAVLSFPGHALVVAPHQGGHLVVLAERALLSRLVTLVHRSLNPTP
ncbi:hypothetical protein [Oceanithermus sp.]